MLGRALAVYAAAFVAVAILARAAIIAIGLPDWVFPGALVVMALGLPVVLFTALHAGHCPSRSQCHADVHAGRYTLAGRSRHHGDARRSRRARTSRGGGRSRGGMVAVGVFVLLIAGYMALRALGIGPAGSLLASGKLSSTRQGDRRRI